MIDAGMTAADTGKLVLGDLRALAAGALVLLNAAAFFCYGLDKFRAKHGGHRISERTLLVLALLGASPGSLLAQSLFRHKTVKRSFRVRFFTIVLLQVLAALAWIYLARTGRVAWPG